MSTEKVGIDEIIENVSNLSVLELFDLIEGITSRFGITIASVRQDAAPTPVNVPVVEEQAEYSVILKSFGDKKLNIIKELRALTGLGLLEAKTLVESAPKVVREGLSKQEADTYKLKLEAAGAVIELQ